MWKFSWLVTLYYVILFNFKVANNLGLKITVYHLQLQLLSSKSHSFQLLAKKSAEDDKSQFNGDKKEKDFKVREGWKLPEELNTSQSDVMQIAKLYNDKTLPGSVKDRLKVTELILLKDISIFLKTFPDVEISDEFQQRNERIKRGGDFMGNDLERISHKSSQLYALSIANKKTIRRSYFDDISASHVCNAAATDLQEIHV
jgi:hypothetical protein